ncbi:MAG: long-chain fatty acid--CoA ligase [bacterium]
MKPGIAEVPGPYNLVEIFENSVRKHGGRKLFGTKNRAGTAYDWVTYADVGRRVDDLRGGLASIGVNKGDGVAIIANNCVEWAVACYATYGRAARFIPMYEAELPRILQYIVDDSGSKVLFVSNQEIYEKVKSFPDEIESLESIYLIEGDGENTMAELERIGRKTPVDAELPDGEDIAGLVYTSGTTGNPKGVLLSHRNLSSNVIACFHENPGDMGPDDRTLSFLPWAHSFGQVAELHLLVHSGASTGFAERPDTIVNDLLLVQPTLLVAVPRVFNKVYSGLNSKMEQTGGLAKRLFDMGVAAGQERRRAGGNAGLGNRIKLGIADKIVFSKVRAKFGGRLRQAISSSAALNMKIAEFFADIGIPVYEAWGMTELSPAHTINMEGLDKPGSVGRPILGSWVEIDKTLTGEGSKDGEIIAYGPNVMKGYHNLPDKTAEVLRPDGGLATGDRGWVDEDGHLYITGRIKEQYKLENGKYVFPAGLEEAIKLSPYIENVMVEGANRRFNVAIVVPDFLALGPWGKTQGLGDDPSKLVREPKVEELILSEMKVRCADFAPYETPRKVLLIADPFTTENGILTPTLKLKRREVMKRYGERLEPLFE